MFGNDAVAFETTRAALLKMPRVTETMQWGGLLVYWVLDKAVGGKIFAILDPAFGEQTRKDALPIAFAAGPQRAPELLEVDGVRPAPHLARAHWVALADWAVLPQRDLHAELHAAHAYVFGRMPPRIQRIADLPARDFRELLRERPADTAAKGVPRKKPKSRLP